MKRIVILGTAAFLLAACDPSLPSNCTGDAAQNLIRGAYQNFYKTEAQTPALPTASGFLGFAIGSFQAGAKARAVQIAAMSPSEIRLTDLKELGSGGAIAEKGVKRFRICEALITVPLPGPERVRVGFFEMAAGGEIQTEIEAAP